jgi:hypothetical protein
VAEFCASRQGLVIENVIEMTADVRVDEMFGRLFCVHAAMSPVCKSLKKLTLSFYTFSVTKDNLDWNVLLSILRQCKQLESLGIETEADFDLVGKLPSPEFFSKLRVLELSGQHVGRMVSGGRLFLELPSLERLKLTNMDAGTLRLENGNLRSLFMVGLADVDIVELRTPRLEALELEDFDPSELILTDCPMLRIFKGDGCAGTVSGAGLPSILEQMDFMMDIGALRYVTLFPRINLLRLTTWRPYIWLDVDVVTSSLSNVRQLRVSGYQQWAEKEAADRAEFSSLRVLVVDFKGKDMHSIWGGKECIPSRKHVEMIVKRAPNRRKVHYMLPELFEEADQVWERLYGEVDFCRWYS